MSTCYWLLPPQESGWGCDLGSLAESLRRRWPDAEVAEGDSETSALVWGLAEGGSRWLDAGIDRAGRALHVEGDPDLVVDTVLWFRATHPEPDLVLVDEADGTPHPVTSSTSGEDLMAVVVHDF